MVVKSQWWPGNFNVCFNVFGILDHRLRDRRSHLSNNCRGLSDALFASVYDASSTLRNLPDFCKI